jgi:hypothetical protein
MWTSALETAADPDNLELVVRFDEDDPALERYGALHMPKVTAIAGPHIVLSEYWNEAHRYAKGPIFMHCGDDIVFRTEGWDSNILAVFEDYPDGIVFVHGNDLYQTSGLGTHGFIHKNWVDAVGYFVPPYFSSDWNDVWLTEVADMIGRHVYLTDVITEHMHWAANKGEVDQTHLERMARHQQDNVDTLYGALKHQREADAAKLRKVMDAES